MKAFLSTARSALLVIGSLLLMIALSQSAHASTAYGTLNNFDCVNDTGVEAHGFEIELDDVRSTDITYTYDYNHYGVPKITQDNTDPAHPKVFIRYAATRKPDGTWTAFTAIPSGPITPTDGHQFTNPSVNFGGEHFGAGYYGAPTAVKYNWLIDDGTGNLVHGPPVYVAAPTFTYYPPVVGQPLPQVQAVIVPPPPPAPPVLQFGEATWVKDIKTTTHNPNKVELRDLVDPDPGNPGAKNWANNEPTEVETEWRILQTEFANAGNPKGELRGRAQDLPGGDEVVTRRYEFYKYTGPIDAETGEAMADTVAADGIHGSGSVTYADHFDVGTGEWVTVTVDLSTVVVVGEFFGAQMAGFDVVPVLGLIDHIPDGELNVPYAERTVVVPGANTSFRATTTGSLPVGTTLGEFTGIFSGTPTAVGVFTFTVDAKDLFTDAVLASKEYTVTIPGGAAATSSIATSASPAAGGSTTGDGVYDNGTPLTVLATHNPGFAFLNWTEGGVEVSASSSYPFTVNTNRTLVANFVADAPKLTVTVSPPTVVGGTTSTGKVTLTAPAPAGGAVVTLASDTPAATVPASLKIGAGATSKTFTVSTTPVAASTAASISASYSGTSAAATLAVTPAVPSKVTLNPTKVIGGVSSKGTVTLSGKAPAGGASITLSSSTLAAGLPSPVTIPPGATSTTFQVTTAPVTVSTQADISASYNGATVQATLTVNPAVLSKVTLGATSVVGGGSVATNTVTLTGAAPPAGVQVTLTSSSPTATVPSSLTVPAGATSAPFTVTTTPVAASISVKISASSQGVTKTANLTVKAPAVAGLSLSPSTVQGGSPSAATVTLTGLAPAGGTVVTLKSSKAALAAVPATVTVLEGASSADFTVTTTSGSAATAVTISASGGGVSKNAKLTVTP